MSQESVLLRAITSALQSMLVIAKSIATRNDGFYVSKCTLLIVISLLSSCASHQQNFDNVDTANLAQLESVRIYPRTPSTSKTELSQLRVKSLEDSAMTIGAQGGLSWASDRINIQRSEERRCR